MPDMCMYVKYTCVYDLHRANYVLSHTIIFSISCIFPVVVYVSYCRGSVGYDHIVCTWCLQYSCIRAIGGVFFSVVVDPLGVLLVGEARP